ncbi:NUDIX hydrolase [Salibaculum griseiflavum]|uniref:DNA mismatch repair protein MutT n=1 Tax=Salibaculum griseiflavum TaxID=1914409 RepID=A0A2V1P363_9RHOB|nr:NUDIX hydrolase [Salibaculum griseiflavum]PWG16210.1 DNA mismatch repair protein MutT [Salibaculum griseiflavum]
MDKREIRDAATVIVLRDRSTAPKILMGQRGAGAAFMPSKFVFPGGAVDAVDETVPFGRPLRQPCADRLAENSDRSPHGLAAAAIREFWEETGQQIGVPGKWPDAPRGWRGFAASGHWPDAAPLQFVFRAITPPGPPRRFDARFFLVEADALTTNPDDFSRAEEELSYLHWVPLSEARALDLPFITEVVLAEIAAGLNRDGPPEQVPFFHHEDERHLITRLAGRSPLDGV